jgi:hypothetical protein
MSERHAHDRIIAGRHVLEHVELAGDERQRIVRPAEEPDRGPDGITVQQTRRIFHLCAGELQPQLGGLMDGLKQVLVAVNDVLGTLLQPQQLVGAQVPLVVGRGCAGQNRSIEVRHDAWFACDLRQTTASVKCS